MKQHTYYRIIFELISPLAVGNGGTRNSAHDCVRHKDGSPYIPASAVAGAFRNFCNKNKDFPDDIFGGDTLKNNGIIFSNAELRGESVSSVRETIMLKEKSTVENTDFSMEVVETGAEFILYIEIDKFNQDKQGYIEKILKALSDNLFGFGAKTSRGYGFVKINSLKKLCFDIDSENDLNKWLGFDMFSDSEWDNISEFVPENQSFGFYGIRISMKQESSVAIRVFDTGTTRGNEKYVPDQKHITLRSGQAVIPGTSWAGAFRERFRLFAGDEDTENLFGRENISRSKISFSESVIKDCIFKNTTRNSIDRFSAKIKSGAIYIERTCSGGTAELLINVPDNISEKDKKCLSAVIFDLNLGLLSIGGLASVGHGIFSIESITVNGCDKTDCLEKNDLFGLWR